MKRVRGEAAPGGEVSRHLHEHTRAGDRLRDSVPYGDLVLDHLDAPLLLASAGIGCTPVLSMLEFLAEQGHDRPVTVVHGDRSPADHALRAHHVRLTEKLPEAEPHFWYEPPEARHPAHRTGLVDLNGITVLPGAHACLCGSLPFTRTVRTRLLEAGVRPADIHYEVFGPGLWPASA